MATAERTFSPTSSGSFRIHSLYNTKAPLSIDQCMHYIVLRAQARHAIRLSLTLDTLIFDTARYYSILPGRAAVEV